MTATEIMQERLMCLRMGLARDVARALGIHVSNNDSRVNVISNIVNELVEGYKKYNRVTYVETGANWQLSDNVVILPSDDGYTAYNHTRREQTRSMGPNINE